MLILELQPVGWVRNISQLQVVQGSLEQPVVVVFVPERVILA